MVETVFSVIFIVPQMLAMMVDIEDEPEWSASDDPDDDDCDRYLFIITRSGSSISMFLAGSPIFLTAYLCWYKLNQSYMAQINTCGWVSYHKIRVGRSEKYFLNNFFLGFSGFLTTLYNNYFENTRYFGTVYDQPASTRRK